MEARHGTYYLISDRHDGGFAFGGVLLAGNQDEYGLKFLEGLGGRTATLTRPGYQQDGDFARTMPDPLTARIEPNGRIVGG